MRHTTWKRVSPWCLWWLCSCGLLLVGISCAWGADDSPSLELSPSPSHFLQLPEKQWVALRVNVEEWHPFVGGADDRSEIRSLAVMPEILIQFPDKSFRPFIGMGFGLSFNGLPFDTPLTPPPTSVEESVVMHVGGGFAYHLGDKLALTGSARFAQFGTSHVLHRLTPSDNALSSDGLHFSAYTVAFGIRLAY